MGSALKTGLVEVWKVTDNGTALYLLKRRSRLKEVFTRSEMNKLFQSIDEILPYSTTLKNSGFF